MAFAIDRRALPNSVCLGHVCAARDSRLDTVGLASRRGNENYDAGCARRPGHQDVPATPSDRP
jgi:hypothetical protein